MAAIFDEHRRKQEFPPKRQLTATEITAYQKVIDIIAAEGADSIVSEMLFMFAKYAFGPVADAASLLTLPTARIQSQGGATQERQEIERMFLYLLDQDSSIENEHIVRQIGRQTLKWLTKGTGYAVETLGHATSVTTKIMEGGIQSSFRNLAQIPAFQPVFAYLIGMYADIYQKANLTENTHLISPEEERQYRYRLAHMAMRRMLELNFTTNDRVTVLGYESWLKQNRNTLSSDELTLMKGIQKLIIPRLVLLAKYEQKHSVRETVQ